MLFYLLIELFEFVVVLLLVYGFYKHSKVLEKFGFSLKRIEWKNVFSIILLVIFVDLIFIWFSRPVEIPANNYSVIHGLILSPIWEEIVFRGLLLGAPLVVLLKINSKIRETSLSFNFLALFLLLFQAAVFFLAHPSGSAIVLVNGLLFGLIYLLFKKNLLSSMVAHSTANLLVIIIQFFGLLSVIH